MIGPAPQPLGEFGLLEPVRPQDVLITDATIWTSGPEGILTNAWLLVSGGKVMGVGTGAPSEAGTGVLHIDAKGKHITPGLIDCHSHTGICAGSTKGRRRIPPRCGSVM